MAVTGMNGTVKSWNGAKGFGFISAHGLAGDIMFSRNELPDDVREVQGKFMDGRPVVFDAQRNPDGRYKATSVAVPYVEGKDIAGKIKTYSEKHGYGFITSSSLTEDVRFQRTDLPAVPPGVHLNGELVTFDVQAMPDGKLRVGKLMFQSKKIATRVSGGSMMGVPGLMEMLGMGGMGKGGLASLGGSADAGMKRPASAMGGILGLGGILGMLGGAMMQQKVAVAETPTGRSAVGMIKTYNGKKGFGFISSPGIPGDVFFMMTSLPAEAKNLQGTDLQGKNVKFEISQTSDGKARAQNITLV